MNRNRFLMLVAVTLVAIVLVVVLDRSGDSGPGETPKTLLTGLAGAVNALDAIDVVAPGGEIAVSLRRDDERWRVAQKDGYEADFGQVLALLRSLAEAGVAEPKTNNPDWYAHLGVQDVGQGDATGRRIDFPGREIPSVIIGQIDPSGEGSYARRPDENQSWLLDAIIEVPVDPVAWLERGVMDIPSADIAAVVIRHSDGEVVRLDRVGDETDDNPAFVLRNVPEGRQAGGEWKRNVIANGLRALNLQDVRKFQPPAPDAATRVLLTTADGLNFVADLFELDDAYWVHFTVSAESVVVPEVAVEDDQSNAITASAAAAAGEAADEADANDSDASNQRLVNAVAVDARLSPWMFAIPERRFNDLTQRMDDLLEPVEQQDEV